MNDRDFDELLDAYFSDAASPRELTTLEGILRDDPNRRLALAKRSLLEVHLHKAFSGLAPTIAPMTPAKAPAASWSRSWLRIAQGTAAAVLLVAVGWVVSALLTHTVADRTVPIAAIPERKAEALPIDKKSEPAAQTIKKAMASLGGVKGTDVGRIDGTRVPRVEPKKDVVATAKDTKPNAAAIDPPDDGKQGILVPDGKGKGPADAGSRNIRGVLRAFDSDAATLTVRTKVKGRDTDRVFAIDEQVAVFAAGKASGVEHLRLGTEVRLRLSEDRQTVIEIREGKD